MMADQAIGRNERAIAERLLKSEEKPSHRGENTPAFRMGVSHGLTTTPPPVETSPNGVRSRGQAVGDRRSEVPDGGCRCRGCDRLLSQESPDHLVVDIFTLRCRDDEVVDLSQGVWVVLDVGQPLKVIILDRNQD